MLVQTTAEAVATRAITSIAACSERTGLSEPTTDSTIDRLVETGILRELTGKRRNRVFAYGRFLALLAEGTEPGA